MKENNAANHLSINEKGKITNKIRPPLSIYVWTLAFIFFSQHAIKLIINDTINAKTNIDKLFRS